MRLIKAQNTNLRNIYGKGVKYDVNEQVILDSNNVMLVPKGTTAQRPASPVNGHIRYNTTTEQLEAYQNGAWRKIRFKEPNQDPGITQQNLGFGDDIETIFGPLESGDSEYPVPIAAQNILVFIENVFQLSTTNYTLVQNPGGPYTISSVDSIDGVTGFPSITTSSAHGLTTGDLIAISGLETDPDDNLELLNIADDSTSPGSVAVTVLNATQLEVHIDVTGSVPSNYIANTGKVYKAGTFTGPYLPGTYIQFNEAPPSEGEGGNPVPITVLHNFDK